jgi:hypothetical protein
MAPEIRSVPARANAPLPLTNGQLALQLPSELPHLTIEPEWKDQQRLWGHSFHPMCSYLASFPASLVHAFIARWTRSAAAAPLHCRRAQKAESASATT